MSFIVVQTNNIMNEVRTYNRQRVNNKSADMLKVSYIVVQTNKIMNEAQ